jgi:hypothetical protein
MVGSSVACGDIAETTSTQVRNDMGKNRNRSTSFSASHVPMLWTRQQHPSNILLDFFK